MIKNVTAHNIGFILCLILSIGAVFTISANSLLNLPVYWGKDEYSHGFLIPIIAAFIGWHILSRDKPEINPSWTGILVLGFSLFLSALSELAAFEALLNYSFIVALFGLSLGLFGKKFTFSLLPALLFLFFAAPLPHIVYGNLSLKMQLISSTLGTDLIHMFGYSVFQDGNIIDLGLMKLQVVEACNGLRYLFPLMSLGYLIAYLMDDKWWKRIVVFLSVAPITILMNSLRIAMIGVTVNIWGQDMAEGVLHVFEGFVVFGICLVFLMGLALVLMRIGGAGRFRDEYLGFPKGKIVFKDARITPTVMVCLLLSLCGSAFFFSGALKNRLENTPVTPDFSSFPSEIGEWNGERDYLTLDEVEALDLTDYWMANYVRGQSNLPVNLYVAYYNSQRMRANIHVPLNCILGGGWKVDQQTSMSVETGALSIPVKRLVIRKGNETGVVYYWLEQRGRKISNALDAKLFLVWDSIMMHRTDGALVRVTTPLGMGETAKDADDRLQYFLQKTYPTVESFIPGR